MTFFLNFHLYNMSELFESYLKRTEKYLHKLEKNEEVVLYSKKILCFYEATSLLYPNETNHFFEKLKIIDILDNISKDLNKKIPHLKNDFLFDYSTQNIFYKEKVKKMISSKQIVLDLFKINEQSMGHYLLLSLISQKEFFEIMQVYFFKD